MLISIIIPCYCSENNLAIVVNEIVRCFDNRLNYDYQIILVCDASPDETFAEIKKLCKGNSQIIGLNLSRNFGQQAARMAALPHVQGDYIVYMDDDGQHPAEGIFSLVEKAKQGFDIVYACFSHKQHSIFQRFGSQVNRIMAERFIGKPTDIVTSSFFVVNSFVAKELERYHSPTPYILGYLMQITQNIANVEILHRSRISGKSGYTASKLFRLWLNGFTSFSVKPLRIASALGFCCAVVGFLFAIYIVIRKLIYPEIAAGYSSLMSTIMVVGGMLMLLLGMLGEYVGRILLTLNNLPQYVVNETINSDCPEDLN